jgi:hypothetical protein
MALGIAMLTLAAAVAGAGERPALMPWPSSFEKATGELQVSPGFKVTVTGSGGPIVDRAVRRFESRLARQTGLFLPDPVAEAQKAGLQVRCDGAGKPLPHLGMNE